MPRVHAGPAAFARLLTNLLPSGDAWPEEPAAVQQQALLALAAAFATLNDRANALVTDAFPRTAVELLPEWERSLGLPDECSPLEPTVVMRQQAVVAKLIARGGQSAAYMRAIAAAAGTSVGIEQFAPFRADANRADDPANDPFAAFLWRVSLPTEATAYLFRADTSYADERLDVFDQGVVECRLRQAAPAHTRLSFAYGASGDQLLGVGDGQPLTGVDDGQPLTGQP